MRTLRTYSSSMQAMSDVVVLESQGIATAFKGAIQADAHQAVVGTVELQVSEDDYATAEQLLTGAEKERTESIPPQQRQKTPGRYFKIALVSALPLFALFALFTPFLERGVAGWLMSGFLTAVIAGMISFFCALMDL